LLRLGGLQKQEISYINRHGGTLGWSLLLNTVRPSPAGSNHADATAGVEVHSNKGDEDEDDDDGALYSEGDARKEEL
jgi:hypothetical protein